MIKKFAVLSLGMLFEYKKVLENTWNGFANASSDTGR